LCQARPRRIESLRDSARINVPDKHPRRAHRGAHCAVGGRPAASAAAQWLGQDADSSGRLVVSADLSVAGLDGVLGSGTRHCRWVGTGWSYPVWRPQRCSRGAMQPALSVRACAEQHLRRHFSIDIWEASQRLAVRRRSQISAVCVCGMPRRGGSGEQRISRFWLAGEIA